MTTEALQVWERDSDPENAQWWSRVGGMLEESVFVPSGLEATIRALEPDEAAREAIIQRMAWAMEHNLGRTGAYIDNADGDDHAVFVTLARAAYEAMEAPLVRDSNQRG
jgi:hypothetical protein